MEIKTDFMDAYTKKIDKLLNQCQHFFNHSNPSIYYNENLLIPHKWRIKSILTFVIKMFLQQTGVSI
jgi:hypothetical protein